MPRLSPRLAPSLLAFAMAPAATLVLAAEPALEPLLVTGSRVERASLDLPAAVTVIDGETISEGAMRVNASESLQRVPGLTAANRQNYAQDLQIASRGFGARSAFGVRGLRLLTDGIPATMPDGQGQAATLDLDVARRIEVLRGPYSVIYGNHAGGVIQMFTREPEDGSQVETRLLGGPWGTWKADLNAQGRIGDYGYLVDASRFSTEGYRAHSAATRDQGLAKLVKPLDGGGKLTLILSQLSQNDTEDPLGLTWATYQQNPRAVESAAISFNTRKSIDHTQGGLRWERPLGGGKLDLVAYYGERGATQYQSIPQSAQNSPRSSGGVVAFWRDFGGVNAHWSTEAKIGTGVLTTTFGLDYDRSRDDRRGYLNFIGSTLGVMGALRRNEIDTVANLDPYAQFEWASGPWEFTAGLRHSDVRFDVADHYLGNGDDSGAASYRDFTGMAGARYKLDARTSLYVSAARGLETPTLNELFYSGSGGGFNLGLKSAASKHFEAGVKSGWSESLRAELALFEVRTQNELVVDVSSGGRTSYRNAASTLRQGAEASLQASLPAGLSASLALSAMRATYDQAFAAAGGIVPAGNRLPAVPELSGFAELAWHDAAHGHFVGLEIYGRGRIFAEDSNTAKAAPGFATASLRAGTEVRAGAWTFSPFLRIDNLANRKYIGSVIVGDGNGRYYEPAPERSVFAGINCRWR